MKRMRTIALSAAAQVIRPVFARTQPRGGLNVRFVTPAELPPAGFIAARGDTRKIDPQAADTRQGRNSRLQPYDVLLAVSGAVRTVGIAPRRVADWRCSHAFLILRFLEPADAVCAFMLFRSDPGQKLLAGAKEKSGSGRRTVDILHAPMIRDLQIPVFTPKLQERSQRRFDRLVALYREIAAIERKFLPKESPLWP